MGNRVKNRNFFRTAGLIIGLQFPFLGEAALSASGNKIEMSSCTPAKSCYQITASSLMTSQFAPIWKFYEGQFLLQQTGRLMMDQNIKFKEATWEQISDVFYMESDEAYYSFFPATGTLQKQPQR